MPEPSPWSRTTSRPSNQDKGGLFHLARANRDESLPVAMQTLASVTSRARFAQEIRSRSCPGGSDHRPACDCREPYRIRWDRFPLTAYLRAHEGLARDRWLDAPPQSKLAHVRHHHYTPPPCGERRSRRASPPSLRRFDPRSRAGSDRSTLNHCLHERNPRAPAKLVRRGASERRDPVPHLRDVCNSKGLTRSRTALGHSVRLAVRAGGSVSRVTQ
jgi:hypothetical protein